MHTSKSKTLSRLSVAAAVMGAATLV